MRGFSRALLVLALGLPLAACGNTSNWFKRTLPPPCPSGAIVKEAATKVVYRPGPGRDITDVLYEASLPHVSLRCKYDDTGVEVETAVTIVAARGPADSDRLADLTYFVAVLDPDRKVIGKREFRSRLQFPVNVDRGATVEELVQRIPVGKNISAEEFSVVFGFQLTREELEANRRGRGASLIAPAGVAPSLPSPAAPADAPYPVKKN